MNKIFKIVSFVTQFSLIMIISVAMCFFGGLLLDKKLGTSFICIIGFILGAIGGAIGVWKLIRRDILDDGK